MNRTINLEFHGEDGIRLIEFAKRLQSEVMFFLLFQRSSILIKMFNIVEIYEMSVGCAKGGENLLMWPLCEKTLSNLEKIETVI